MKYSLFKCLRSSLFMNNLVGLGMAVCGVFFIMYHLGYEFGRSGSLVNSFSQGWPFISENIIPSIMLLFGFYLSFVKP